MTKKSVVEAKFLRFDLKSKYTKLCKDMSSDDLDVICCKLNLSINETPIIAFFQKLDYWWLITNVNFIIYDKINVSYMKFAHIEKIQVTDALLYEKSKLDCSDMDILYKNRNVKIFVEAGTWHAIYSIMKFLTSNDKKTEQTNSL